MLGQMGGSGNGFLFGFTTIKGSSHLAQSGSLKSQRGQMLR